MKFNIAELAKYVNSTVGTVRLYLSRAEFTECRGKGRFAYDNIILDEGKLELLKRRLNRDFRP